MKPFSGAAGLLLIALAACTDQLPTHAPQPEGRVSKTEIACTVHVPSAQVRCGAPPAPGGANRNITVGGQHTNVRLLSSAPVYGDGVFLFDVAVQNLLAQRMGTADGTTVYGVKVFFQAPPSATAGSGTIEVLGADTATFTASNQLFFHYDEILEPMGTSQPLDWRFMVPPTVTTFTFTVLVETRLASETGVLRWQKMYGDAARGLDVNSVWGTTARNVFAVGGMGLILHFNGHAWSRMPSPTTRNLLRVSGADERNVYAVADQGGVLRYDGNRWSEIGSDPSFTLSGVWASGSEVWLVGSWYNASNGYNIALLRHSTDRGATWTSTFHYGPSHTFLGDIWGSGNGELWAAGTRHNPGTGLNEGILLHSTDGGGTWSETVHAHAYNRTLRSIWGSGSGHLYAVGNQGTAQSVNETIILRSTDEGATWDETATPGREGLDVWGAGEQDVYVVEGRRFFGELDRQSILRSTDGGDTWTPSQSPVVGSHFLKGIWGSGTGDVWGVGSGGVILHHDGAAWFERERGTGDDLRGVWASADGVWAVGTTYNPLTAQYEGMVARSAAGGGSWAVATSANASKERNLYGIWGTGPTDLWMVGDEITPYGGGAAGLILHSADGGMSWTTDLSEQVDGSRSLRGVWGYGSNVLYMVGWQLDPVTARRQGVILRRDGPSWSAIAIPHTKELELTGVWGSGPNDVWAVGHRMGTSAFEGVILHSTDGGTNWTVTPSTHPARRHLTAVWGSGPNDVWVAGYQTTQAEGVVLHSTDGGASWTETTFPGSVARELRAVWGTSPTNVYAAGGPGLILHYDGTRWSEMSAGTENYLFGLAGSSAGELFAVGERAIILRGSR